METLPNWKYLLLLIKTDTPQGDRPGTLSSQVPIEGRSLIACLAQSTSKATPVIQDVSRERNQ